jgi:8-oxo-dGTP pyrophosphatase MutT (NUDIX family)
LTVSRASSQISRYEALLRSREETAASGAEVLPMQAAVFVLFAEHRGKAEVLLIRRPLHRGRHRGEWAFPGGVREPEDASLLQTAYRETEEELGIPARAIEHWGPLDPVQTNGTGFTAWPFTGRVEGDFKLRPSAEEVAEVARVPADQFTAPDMRRSILLRRDGGVRRLQAYACGGRVIWGATARILAQIFDDELPAQAGPA